MSWKMDLKCISNEDPENQKIAADKILQPILALIVLDDATEKVWGRGTNFYKL